MQGEQLLTWYDQMSRSEFQWLLRHAMDNASQNLSQMVDHPVRIDVPRTLTIPLDRVAAIGGEESEDLVGVYLLIEGDLRGQTIMMLSRDSALCLVDLLMQAPEGTAAQVGDLERSALAEVGNVTVASFLNAIVGRTGMTLRPSPPAVRVEKYSELLKGVAMAAAVASDRLLILETTFTAAARSVLARFWVLPELEICPIAAAL